MRNITGRVLLGSVMFVSASAHALTWESVLTFIKTMGTESSAWAVTVKQTSIAANQQSQSEAMAKKQLATAIGAIRMSNRAVDAVTSVDSKLGQAVTGKCIAQRNGQLHVEAVSQKERDAGRLMASFSSGRVGSRAAANAEALSVHRETYCTISEAKQGMCALSANGMQGWDVNYAGAFGESTLAPEGELAGYAYIAMIADVRADAHGDCTTTACAAAQSQQLATAAMGAMVANSLIGQVTDRRVPMLTGK